MQVLRHMGALSAATALIAPQAVLAVTPREAQLEARLEKLEAEMTVLRAEMAQARAQQDASDAGWQAASRKGDDTAVRVAALEAKPQPAPTEGMKVAGSTIRIGGYLKLVASISRFSDGEVATNSLGRDFYLPQAIPTGGAPASEVTDSTAKQSRFWLNFASDVAGHTVKGYLETDFQTAPGTQGSQRTTNGYDLALRRAYLQIDRWTFGQDWSTFQYTGALPESTDFVGATEGTVFVRQPLIRYSAPVGKGMTLHLAMEEPESGTATSGSAALIENGDDRLPDFTARFAWTGKVGEISLAGLARQVRVENAGVAAESFGWGISAGGKLFLNSARTADIRALVTYGHNASRYVGLNFAPDAVLDAATNRLHDVNVFAALAAVRVPLSPTVRANLIGSIQSVNYADALGTAAITTYNKRAWSAAANIFYSPVKQIDLGIEYRHGEHELAGGADGQLDRLEMAAKYSF